MNEELVSIIMPAYNCEKLIGKSIDSVLMQSYTNWELITVDDCSTDGTAEVIKKYAAEDGRIRYFKNDKNSGAAVTRNNALEYAAGRYIAFLDSDDLWRSDKLEKQVEFMRKNGYSFTCTAYDKIDESGNSLNYFITADKKADYHRLLKKCPGNSTVMYDASVLGKHTIPNIRKRNDYVMWLKIIKKAGYIYGMDEILGSHRICAGSLSSSKKTLIKYHWYVYRKIEKLSFLYSSYLVIYWILKSVLKFQK